MKTLDICKSKYISNSSQIEDPSFQMGPFWRSFCVLLKQLLHNKIADVSGIQTQIVGIEGRANWPLEHNQGRKKKSFNDKKIGQTLNFVQLWNEHILTLKSANFLHNNIFDAI